MVAHHNNVVHAIFFIALFLFSIPKCLGEPEDVTTDDEDGVAFDHAPTNKNEDDQIFLAKPSSTNPTHAVIFPILGTLITIALGILWVYRSRLQETKQPTQTSAPTTTVAFVPPNPDSNGEEEICAVCCESPTQPEQLACRHVFCKICIRNVRLMAWQGEPGYHQDACPLCRAPLEDCAEKAFTEAVVLLFRNERLMALHPDSDRAQALQQDMIASLERTLSMEEDHVGALITLGETLSDHNPKRAIDLLQRSLSLSDDNSAALLALGKCFKHTGKQDEAMQHFRKTVEAAAAAGGDHNNKTVLGDAHVQVAMLLEELGDIQGAVREYEAAMAADPQSVLIPFNMGVTQEETDNKGAIQAYRKALLLEPDFSPANIAIAKAYRQKIVSGAQDNSYAAGIQRAEDTQHWLGALLRVKNNGNLMMDLEERQYCDDEIATIQRLFPNVWALYETVGDSAMMSKI